MSGIKGKSGVYKRTKPVWNKGLKGVQEHSIETRKKISDSMSETKNYAWLGDKVGYFGLHVWVTKWKGSPKHCEMCGNDKLRSRQYHWANIDHKYNRVLDDFIRMCVKCHKRYDIDVLKIKVNRGKKQLYD